MSSLRSLYHFQSGWISVRDLGLGGEKLFVVLGVELHLLVGRRIPHGFGQQLLHVGPQHVVDVGEGQFLDLRARRDVQHLLERHHALRRAGEIDRLVLALIAIDARIVDDAFGDLARQQHLFHLAGEVDQLDGLQLLQRLVGGVEIGEALAVDLAQHHEMALAEAVHRDDVAAAHAGQLGIGEVLPRGGLGEALVGAEAKPDRAGEDRHADDLVAHGIGIDVGDVGHFLGGDLGHHQPFGERAPLLVRIGVEDVVERIVLRAGLQLGHEREGLVGRHRALELLLEGRQDRGLHDVAPLAAPGRDLERLGLGMSDRRRTECADGGQARARPQGFTT